RGLGMGLHLEGARSSGEIAAELARAGVAACVSAACGAWSEEHGWLVETGGAEETIFDLASLTKPMTARAVAASGIQREATLASPVPELGGTASAEATIELLLAHRAGLSPHLVAILGASGASAAGQHLYEALRRGMTEAEAARAVAESRRDDARGP